MENETTNLPFDQILDQEILGWSKFRRTLRREDQRILDQLFEKSRLQVDAGKNAPTQWTFGILLITMLLEQEKEMEELRKKVEEQKEEEHF
jgi:hypothetical protein